jgi:nitrile hydratase beta subunit
MNGIHDMGGMTCFGPINPEENEPVFHTEWERRVFALNIASLAFLGPVDRARHAIERMDPAEYLNTSYYEHWLAGIENMARDFGYATSEELATGKSSSAIDLPHPAPDAEMITGLVMGGIPSTRETGRQEQAFKIGDKVRARNLEVNGHTRLPRYVRGRAGVINLIHGTHLFPDTVAHDQGESPQPLYNVKFEAKELWGENVERKDCLYIDLWEDYLVAE